MGAVMHKHNCKHQTSCTGDSPSHEWIGRVQHRHVWLCNIIRVHMLAALNMWREAMNHAEIHHDYLPCYANPELKVCMKCVKVFRRTSRDFTHLASCVSSSLPRWRSTANWISKHYWSCWSGTRTAWAPRPTGSCPAYGTESMFFSETTDVSFTGKICSADGPAPDRRILPNDSRHPPRRPTFQSSKTCNRKQISSFRDRWRTSMKQQDSNYLEARHTLLFKLAIDNVQVSDLYSPKLYWNMLKCNEKQLWLESMRNEEKCDLPMQM